MSATSGSETILKRIRYFFDIGKISKNTRQNAYELAQTVKWMLFPYRQPILTITTDNGTEFAEHKIISTMLKTDIYFADPYCSWEKGNIEHTNKLIRQYIPKGTDFDTIDDKTIELIQIKINRRPREKVNFMTPNE